MSDKKQKIENIKREIAKDNPSRSQIFEVLRDLESDAISDSEYYDIVGEIFKFNPKFYMTSIYPSMKSLEMTRYIVENNSLYEDERIIYEFRGSVTKSIHTNTDPVKVFVKGGIIYVTNYRIIAQGKLLVGGGSHPSHSFLESAIRLQKAKKARKNGKKSVTRDSLSQELPCYGYQFKSRNHFGLKKKSKSIKYHVFNNYHNLKDPRKVTYDMLWKAINDIKIKLPKTQVTELYEILRKDADHVNEFFKELNNTRRGGVTLFHDLSELWKSEEYESFSDSDYLDILVKLYELDPEHFMSSIYPKMQTWEFPSFLKIKKMLSEKISQKES